MRSMMSRLALVGTLVAPAALAAQSQATAVMTPVAALKVGDMAPDFVVPGATMKGVSAQPVKLSSLRGKTVVLAFFPRARTAGCTKEMETYRDQYAEIFGSGKDATLLAVSNDSAKVTASWASEASFPFTFLADVDNTVAGLYGSAGSAANGRQPAHRRDNIVIGPDGRIAAITRGVLPTDATEYTKLRDQIKAANQAK